MPMDNINALDRAVLLKLNGILRPVHLVWVELVIGLTARLSEVLSIIYAN